MFFAVRASVSVPGECVIWGLPSLAGEVGSSSKMRGRWGLVIATVLRRFSGCYRPLRLVRCCYPQPFYHCPHYVRSNQRLLLRRLRLPNGSFSPPGRPTFGEVLCRHRRVASRRFGLFGNPPRPFVPQGHSPRKRVEIAFSCRPRCMNSVLQSPSGVKREALGLNDSADEQAHDQDHQV